MGGCLKYAATLKNTHRKSLPTGWAQTGTGAALSTLLVSLSYLFFRSSTGDSAVTARHVRPYELIRQVRTGYMFVLADGDFKERFTQKFSDLVHLRSSSLLGVPIFLPFQVATSASPYSSLIQIMQIRQVLLLIFDICI